MPPPLTAHPRWPALIATAVLGSWTWALAHWMAYPNLDPYHDMLESFAWAQTFEWGTFKHPPLFAWVTGVWFSVFPRGDLAFKLLAYTNVAAGLLGVAALARALGLAAHAQAAIVLLLTCLPYTTLAAKFNANTQLLSVWPWTAAALVYSISSRGPHSWAWSTALGFLAAMCVLSKYYSGVFFAGLLAAALAYPAGRRWMYSAQPVWALTVCCLLLTPHLLWLAGRGFVLMDYAMDQGGGSIDWQQLFSFLLLPFVYWLPGWWLCAAAYARSASAHRSTRLWWDLLRRAWQPRGWQDGLFWLALTPWLVSLGFGLTGLVALSSPWALPLGFAFPLLWLRNLSQWQASQLLSNGRTAISNGRVMAGVLAGVLVSGFAWGLMQARQGAAEYYRPTAEAARAIAAFWAQRHPNIPLGWSSGAWPDTAMMPFYVSPGIRALPFSPDSAQAAIAPHPSWTEEGGVLICAHGPILAGQPHRAEPSPCELQARHWLASRGLPAELHTIVARREGLRFPHPQDWRYTVFTVPPRHTQKGQGAKPVV